MSGISALATGLRFTYSGSHGQGLNLLSDLNQLPYNTVGYNNGAYATRPFASMSQILTVQNLAVSNYNAFTIEGNHRLTHGLQFQSSYTYARNLSDEGGGNPTGFVSEIGNAPSDRFHPSLDYGNVEYTRRNRGLGSFLYDLPFGQGKAVPGQQQLAPQQRRGRVANGGVCALPERSFPDASGEQLSGSDGYGNYTNGWVRQAGPDVLGIALPQGGGRARTI